MVCGVTAGSPVDQLRDPRRPRPGTPRAGASLVGSPQNAASMRRRVHRPQLGQRHAEPLDGPRVLLGQRDVGHGEVVGAERDADARLHQAAERVRRDGRRRCRPGSSTSGTGRARPPARRAPRTRSGSSMASGPCAIRSGSTASARRTCAAPPHSPAWSVTWRPRSRAMSIAPRCRSGSGKRASGPGEVHGDQPVGDRRPAPCPARSPGSPPASCERMSVAISRTSTPCRRAAS